MIFTEPHRAPSAGQQLENGELPHLDRETPRETQPDVQYGPHNQSYVSLCEKFWGTFQKPPTEALVVGSPCALKTWRVSLEFNDRRILSGPHIEQTGCWASYWVFHIPPFYRGGSRGVGTCLAS